MDDHEAIGRCRAGEAEAYRHLVERYQREAIGHARAILGDAEEARDAAQEAFLAAYRALDRFDTSRRFYPWLYTILRNTCLKLLAARAARRTEHLDRLELLAGTPGLPIEETLALESALGELGAEDREVLTLRHFDGLTYAELAELLGVPEGTVMSRLFNARRRLRERLERPAAAPRRQTS